MNGNPPTRNLPPSPSLSPPKLTAFQCPSCGASLEVRGLRQTEAIACASCGAIIDITDENYRIISRALSAVRHDPLIPLGTRGKLRGETFEIIGYLRRKINVEGVDYEWSEYLLFNPYKGFRWLTEYNGHWSYVKTTTNVPPLQENVSYQEVDYLGRTFHHFQTAEAEVSYVLGEFYWRVQVGEKCSVSDYVAPPYILSREQTLNEVSWSVGEYIEPETLWQSFGLKTVPPARIGVAPNQPSLYASQSGKIVRLLGLLVLFAVLIHFLFVVFSNDKMVYQNEFVSHQSDTEKALVTDVFEIPGRISNVVIQSKAQLDNSWIYLSMALINEETGNAHDFGREISYYHGVDGGEAWSEGGISDEVILPSVPSGKYYLRIEPDSPSSSVNYSILVYRDVPRWSYFFITLGALSLIPLFYWWRERSFESRRWAESDHPPAIASGQRFEFRG
jgi:hypothetical protein